MSLLPRYYYYFDSHIFFLEKRSNSPFSIHRSRSVPVSKKAETILSPTESIDSINSKHLSLPIDMTDYAERSDSLLSVPGGECSPSVSGASG